MVEEGSVGARIGTACALLDRSLHGRDCLRARTELLGLENRRRIYVCIVEHPGMYLCELQRSRALGMGTLEFHLHLLERHGLVTGVAGENKRSYPAGMARNEKRLLGVLRQESARRIVRRLIERGEDHPGQMARSLKLGPSTLGYPLGKLVTAGFLERSKEGRQQAYRVRDPPSVLRPPVAHGSTSLDRRVDRFVAGFDEIRGERSTKAGE